jgi:predicted TIM-barrel fold metal-dependent hydrolase
VFAAPVAKLIKSIEDRPGAVSLEARLADLNAEGVDKEIVFPQSLQFYFQHPDLEARAEIFRIYNEYIAEISRRSNDRFFGVGIPNYWDPHEAKDSLQRIADLGLKTFQLPINPGKSTDGEAISYTSDEMDPLWSAAADVGLPVCFHIGENIGYGGRGALANAVFNSLMPFRRNLGEMIFGGILDRHPSLKIVFAEAGLSWVPAALQDAEMVFDSFNNLLDYTPRLRPTEYWQRSCFATFMHDPLGLEMIDYIGHDNILWAHDYPHNESTLGYTDEAINAIVRAVPEPIAKKILGETAASLFRLS